MDTTRRSGVLLHPTSLPGPYGRGDLGPQARRFLDRLAEAGQSVWQILPLGPPGWGGSPYAALSAYAGDSLLVSPELLVEQGLLTAADLQDAPASDPGRVDHEAERWRAGLLKRAWQAFHADATPEQRAELEAFCRAQAHWLPDYALFAALKAHYGGGAYWACGWPTGVLRHLHFACEGARDVHREAVEVEVFGQFLFERQWQDLHHYARRLGLQVLGDLPIFVARDSVDVWSRPELFKLDARGEPTAVAGVPPDAFSETGQLWGNPLYDWEVHARTGYAWWIERFSRCLHHMDAIRIDHFRGFASYWEVPADAETAEGGEWIPGPRMALFDAVHEALGDLPIVAEDLGEETPDVPELLAASGFPGMCILQFAWSGEADDPFLPENHPEHAVAYTGTHDNETTAGWFANLEPEVRERVVERIGEDPPARGLMRLALSSPAFLTVIPLQDVLGLDNEARTNHPGTSGPHNWTWRVRQEQLEDAAAWEQLRALTEAAGRLRTA